MRRAGRGKGLWGWRGRAGFARNVCVALGNWLAGEEEPPPEAVAVLVEALSDPDPLVRGHAAWALGRVGLPDAVAALEERGGSEPDEWAAGEIRRALSPTPWISSPRWGEDTTVHFRRLRLVLGNSQLGGRIALDPSGHYWPLTVAVLNSCAPHSAAVPLALRAQVLDDVPGADDMDRWRALAVLVEALSDPEPLVRGHAAWALGQVGLPDAVAALEERGTVEPDEWAGGEIRLALGSASGTC